MNAEHDLPATPVETSAGRHIEKLKGVHSPAEELDVILDHVWRNRKQLHEMLNAIIERQAEGNAEVILCVYCDASYSSLAEAAKARWTSLEYDPTEQWDYLGVCPHCRKEQAEREQREREKLRGATELERAAHDMGLTDEQLARAKAEGVTTILGLRRIERNSRPATAADNES